MFVCRYGVLCVPLADYMNLFLVCLCRYGELCGPLDDSELAYCVFLYGYGEQYGSVAFSVCILSLNRFPHVPKR